MKELKELKETKEHEEEIEGVEVILPDGIVYVKPFDQLDLSADELKKEITNTLTTMDPNAIEDSVQYNYYIQAYVKIEPINHLAVFIDTEAHLIPLASPSELEVETDGIITVVGDQSDVKPLMMFAEMEEEEEEEEEEENEDDTLQPFEEEIKRREYDDRDEADGDRMSLSRRRVMKNQFDFRDRAAQTFYMRPKDKETITEDTPSEVFSEMVTQWIIYDAYMEDWEAMEKEKQKEKSFKSAVKKEKKEVSGHFEISSNIVDMVVGNLKIIERMIQLNIYNDIAHDFRYYEDEADDYRIPNGNLLPLWRFRCRNSRKLVVTSLCWNYKYPDMFGVGLGSFNFLTQVNGSIVFYSLTNPSFPEFWYNLESGVMSLDISWNNTYLVVVGLYDGNVAIYNLMNKSDKAWVVSSCHNKHIDPVWQVCWLGYNLSENLTFASISSDGLVLMWVISKNYMEPQKLMTLGFVDYPMPEVEGSLIEICNGGMTFDFHRSRANWYVLGTKEGDIRVCNRAHTNHHTLFYRAHYLSVYKVQWNDYHPDIFISCSADWTIKVWDISVKTTDPMFSFDLGCAVEDVAWAPYSSTTFAAVTASQAYVFDLKFDKTEPLCEQHLVVRKKSKLTKIAFNAKYPVLIIGDDKGAVTTYKLSPNLRRMPKKDKKAFGADTQLATPEEKERMRREVEYRYLENIISMARLGAKTF